MHIWNLLVISDICPYSFYYIYSAFVLCCCAMPQTCLSRATSRTSHPSGKTGRQIIPIVNNMRKEMQEGGCVTLSASLSRPYFGAVYRPNLYLAHNPQQGQGFRTREAKRPALLTYLVCTTVCVCGSNCSCGSHMPITLKLCTTSSNQPRVLLTHRLVTQTVHHILKATTCFAYPQARHSNCAPHPQTNHVFCVPTGLPLKLCTTSSNQPRDLCIHRLATVTK